LLSTLDDDDLANWAAGLKEGVHSRRPVSTAPKRSTSRRAHQRGDPVVGQTTLFDGKSGDPFESRGHVGRDVMLKVAPLGRHKIHARSIGPYSLSRSNRWAEGAVRRSAPGRDGSVGHGSLGAAYALQEFLTVKSDDVIGRTRMYEAIVKGEHKLESGLPESFKRVAEGIAVAVPQRRVDPRIRMRPGAKSPRWS